MLRLRQGLVWTGLMSGPFAWALATQLGYSLGSFACGKQVIGIVPTAIVCLLIALAGMALSWRELRVQARARANADSAHSEQAQIFLAAMGVGMCALFALVILWQGAAALVFDGCERW
jgi:hypothetical protein